MYHRYDPPADPASEEQPGAARAAGLRRLSRLTWRATTYITRAIGTKVAVAVVRPGGADVD